MKSEYYWTFRIETSRFGGVLEPSCDYVTDENREAWQRFVENKIRELMKPETDESKYSEFCKNFNTKLAQFKKNSNFAHIIINIL